MWKCPHKSPSPCNTYVILMSLYKLVSSYVTKTHTQNIKTETSVCLILQFWENGSLCNVFLKWAHNQIFTILPPYQSQQTLLPPSHFLRSLPAFLLSAFSGQLRRLCAWQLSCWGPGRCSWCLPQTRRRWSWAGGPDPQPSAGRTLESCLSAFHTPAADWWASSRGSQPAFAQYCE